MRLILAAAFALVASSLSAQTTVYVNHTGSDVVGVRIAYELKELIRGSNGFTLTDFATSEFEIRLSSMDGGLTNQGLSSAFALLVTKADLFLGMNVGHYGRDKTMNAAKDILAFADSLIQKDAERIAVPTSTRTSR